MLLLMHPRLSQNLIENSEKSDDDADVKLQGEILRLNKRVEALENQMSQNQSNISWKTTFVCLLTNIIIHLLLNARRQ